MLRMWVSIGCLTLISLISIVWITFVVWLDRLSVLWLLISHSNTNRQKIEVVSYVDSVYSLHLFGHICCGKQYYGDKVGMTSSKIINSLVILIPCLTISSSIDT